MRVIKKTHNFLQMSHIFYTGQVMSCIMEHILASLILLLQSICSMSCVSYFQWPERCFLGIFYRSRNCSQQMCHWYYVCSLLNFLKCTF